MPVETSEWEVVPQESEWEVTEPADTRTAREVAPWMFHVEQSSLEPQTDWEPVKPASRFPSQPQTSPEDQLLANIAKGNQSGEMVDRLGAAAMSPLLPAPKAKPVWEEPLDTTDKILANVTPLRLVTSAENIAQMQRSAYNAAAGLWDFTTSPVGIATLGVGRVKALAPVMKSVFTGDVIHSLWTKYPEIQQGWPTMSGPQKIDAVTQFVTTGAIGAGLIHSLGGDVAGAVESRIPRGQGIASPQIVDSRFSPEAPQPSPPPGQAAPALATGARFPIAGTKAVSVLDTFVPKVQGNQTEAPKPVKTKEQFLKEREDRKKLIENLGKDSLEWKAIASGVMTQEAALQHATGEILKAMEGHNPEASGIIRDIATKHSKGETLTPEETNALQAVNDLIHKRATAIREHQIEQAKQSSTETPTEMAQPEAVSLKSPPTGPASEWEVVPENEVRISQVEESSPPTKPVAASPEPVVKSTRHDLRKPLVLFGAFQGDAQTQQIPGGLAYDRGDVSVSYTSARSGSDYVQLTENNTGETVKIRFSDHFAPGGGGYRTTDMGSGREAPPDFNIVKNKIYSLENGKWEQITLDKLRWHLENWLPAKSEVTAQPAPTPTETPKQAADKEPWQMTRKEYQESLGMDDRFMPPQPKRESARMVKLPSGDVVTTGEHGKAVFEAIQSGKPVPPEVLADYPDLQKKLPNAGAYDDLSPELKAQHDSNSAKMREAMGKELAAQKPVIENKEAQSPKPPTPSQESATAALSDVPESSQTGASEPKVTPSVTESPVSETNPKAIGTMSREEYNSFVANNPTHETFVLPNKITGISVMPGLKAESKYSVPVKDEGYFLVSDGTGRAQKPYKSYPMSKWKSFVENLSSQREGISWRNHKRGTPTPKPEPATTPTQAAAKVEAEVKDVAKTEGMRPAKEVKSDYLQRVEDEIDRAIADSETTIRPRGEDYPNEWLVSSKNAAAYGTIEKVGNKFKVSAQRPGDNLSNATFDSIEEAQWFIKALGSEADGKVTINIPGDGETTVSRSGKHLVDLWKKVKSLDTRSETPVAKLPAGGSPTADKVIAAYGSAEKAYNATVRQARSLEDAAERTEAENFAEQIYKKTKAASLESQAENARSSAAERRSSMNAAQAEIDRINGLKKRTKAHLESIEDLKKEAASAKDRMEFFDKQAENYEQQAAKEKATLEKIESGTEPEQTESTPPAEGETGPTHGFGAKIRQKEDVATTQDALAKLQKLHTPGLEAVSNTKQGVLSLLLPTAKSPEHLKAAENLGAKLGAMNRRSEVAAHQLRPSSKLFDRLGVHREGVDPAKNPGIKFMSDLSQGRDLSGPFKAVGELVQKLFGERVEALKEAGAPLQTVRENYFPGMWTRESRLAFNAAMEKAKAEGRIPDDFDVNTASPELKASIKADVDKFLEDGVGSDKDALSYLTRTPMKGKESFRKPKVFEDIMTGAEFGLRPISNNPIDLVKLKLAEMDKSIMANQFFKDPATGVKVIDPYEEVPDGMVKINDKYGTIYGPPTTKVNEYIDKAVFEGLEDFAKSIGVRHERSMKFPPGQGTRALGLAYQGEKLVRTKFATETSVLAHEIGHQLDYKYNLWQAITGGEKGNERRSEVQKDLRAIADMTGSRGGQTRSKAEKIAQMVEAYVHAPEAMAKEAPLVYRLFDNFIRNNRNLKALSEIKPGIELEKLTSEKYVGLPIIGYRIVPESVGDVVNNYLSSSLYNNKYFGNIYKAWMGAANALNQTQLGMGSAFHAGFTTGDVQISAGANLIKDVYGVMRGNRSVGELADTAKTFTVSSIKTAMTGDKILNAWRNPDGVIDPKVAQIVKATELAGGGYKMEQGMTTEQTTKLMRDWFSGHRIKAAARSPIALTELMAKPIMDWLVPRQKAGVFSELAARIIEQHPDTPLEELTPQFRQAWNRVDARLGQVRYNRMFTNNTAKNIVQGIVRAPGWTGGTIAEIGGAFPDTYKFFKEWKDTGRLPENIPDRVAYTASLLLTMGAANAVLTYLFTGTQPKGMDFLAFRSGKKDEQGNEERFLLPSYIKDLIAYARQPVTTLEHKAHPLLGMIDDIAHNKDYYGYEIRNPHDNAAAQAGQVAKYVIKSFEPFWTRGARKEVERKSGPLRTTLPFFGVMPAPSYITRTPIQNEIAELYHKRTGDRIKPFGTEEKDAEKRQAKDKSTLDVYMWKRLPKSDKDELHKKMTTQEKSRYP